jgi:hypothetical protein
MSGLEYGKPEGGDQEIGPMSSKSVVAPQVVGKLAVKLSGLPEEDLQLVAEFVDYLGEKRPAESSAPLSAKRIREEAKRRSHLLRDVPREQLIARFAELGEQIRQEAISSDSAVDGDWTGD